MDGWPSFKHFHKSLQQFVAVGFAGPLWLPSDPSLLPIIVRPYRDLEVAAVCIWHDRPARVCDVGFITEHNIVWVDTVGWPTTWKCMEKRAQAFLGLPPHREIVFFAGAHEPSMRQHVGPSFGLHP